MKIFSLSTLPRGPQKIFHHSVNPFLAALVMVFKKGVKLGRKKNREFLYPYGEKVEVVNWYIYLSIKFGNLRRMEVINGKYESKRHTEIKSTK
jgi:hypothetical protein